jgi:cytochrome c
MKKAFFIIGLSLVVAACGGNKSGSGSSADSASTANKPAATAASGADLIAKSNCSTCHKEQEKLIGPAFADVAAKYKSGPDGIVDTLANKIIKGGSGVWGTVPMTGHPDISIDDARTIVKYILTIKKQ